MIKERPREISSDNMKEVEIKIIEIDKRKVEDNLVVLGAMKTFEGEVETWFFDFQDSTITRRRNLLRVRRIGDKASLTFKRFVDGESAKIRHEYEVGVSDFETMCLILESIGLTSTLRMKKHRTSYTLKTGVKVDIDRYAGEYSHIPELLEIEGENAEVIRMHAKLLGFQPEDCRSWTTFDLIDYYSGKKVET